ncbi:PREDICTED: villin-1-like isoform X2 [Priapulus caudatus]|uniref:Villin-1-like isoform X2 n=1 Tax=Priapulus caudatus TaxID=37621 RepID=A0ABM1F9A8_PRICU|nr:PREDICTED: villin-1-like isoform X2 [Priapulus caudatus]
MVDAAFKSIPRGQTCFHIWRIEQMRVVSVPREQFGNFYSGDSYIILSVKEDRGSLESHIHFWLGQHTSQDEAGAAAIKSVELDDALGGSPVQHREVQGNESKRYLSYFKKGIRYLEGGVASGFNHVDNVMKPRLFQVKGQRNIRVLEVPISWSSFNEGDSFILDVGKAIFVWNGKSANRIEKIRAADVAARLKAEHGGAHMVFVEDGHEKDFMSSEERVIFNQFLDLAQKSVKPASDDREFDRRTVAELKLYRCSDEDGTLKVTEVKDGPLYKADLDSHDSFIIDNGAAGIWVWVGKEATKKERSEAMRNAQGFIKKKGYPNMTTVTRVIDGGEPVEFRALFNSWSDPEEVTGMGKTHTVGKIARTVQTKFDALTMHDNSHLAAESQMPDDGTGQKEIWRIENMEMAPADKRHYGQFYSGDCYVILYQYEVHGSRHYLIYYWQGLYSTTDEKGVSAAMAIALDDQYGGKPVQVRVVQGKEPPHFMAMFAGKMVIFTGGKASGFRNTDQRDEVTGDSYLLHVRGTTTLNTKAVEVELRAASLNSNDVFVLFTKHNVFIWAGKGCSGDEREMAKHLATSLSSRDPALISEGHESEEFWRAIGGEEPYSSDRHMKEEASLHPPRLFQASNASGRFQVEEIVDFSQIDLVEDDVMILDAWDNIFLWVGHNANADEKRLSTQAAIEYLETDPSSRDPDTPIVKVSQGYEPPTFTGFFGVWDRNIWNNAKTYEDLKREMQQENPGLSVVVKSSTSASAEIAKYSYAELTKPPELLPAGVDGGCREIHLTEADFERVFGMSYSDFASKPQWKQQQMKKDAKLF